MVPSAKNANTRVTRRRNQVIGFSYFEPQGCNGEGFAEVEVDFINAAFIFESLTVCSFFFKHSFVIQTEGRPPVTEWMD